MSKISDVWITKKDVGKNIYRKTTKYILTVEEDFIAENADKAQDMSMNTGLDYDKINSSLVDTKAVSEVYCVDANYSDSDMKYIGKVKYDEDDEFAEEDGNVVIDTYADELSQIREAGL